MSSKFEIPLRPTILHLRARYPDTSRSGFTFPSERTAIEDPIDNHDRSDPDRQADGQRGAHSRQLVQLAGQGDREALAQLFLRSIPRLRRLLALKAGPGVLRGNELDDLVQEAYLEATRSFAAYVYEGPDSFFRWLAQVALHRMQNLRRIAGAQKRQGNDVPIEANRSTIVPGSVEPPMPGPGPRTMMAGVEAVERIDRAMARLSDVDRQVIALSRVHGLSLQEVADRMHRSRNAAALLLSRALRRLKELLAKEA